MLFKIPESCSSHKPAQSREPFADDGPPAWNRQTSIENSFRQLCVFMLVLCSATCDLKIAESELAEHRNNTTTTHGSACAPFRVRPKGATTQDQILVHIAWPRTKEKLPDIRLDCLTQGGAFPPTPEVVTEGTIKEAPENTGTETKTNAFNA